MTPWGETIIEEKTVDKRSFRFYVTNAVQSVRQRISVLKPQPKIRIKHLLTVKRVIAGILCVVHLCAFIATVPQAISGVFLSTGFVLLDYLWKTRVAKWISDDPR